MKNFLKEILKQCIGVVLGLLMALVIGIVIIGTTFIVGYAFYWLYRLLFNLPDAYCGGLGILTGLFIIGVRIIANALVFLVPLFADVFEKALAF